MSSHIDFAKKMIRAQDEELLSVIASERFVPAAVDAAKAELKRRNLKPDDLARLRAQVQKVQRFEDNKHLLPLTLAGKLAFLALGGPFLYLSLPVAGILRVRGYRRKSNAAFKCIGISFAVLIGILFLF